jgi:hypothetical protein
VLEINNGTAGTFRDLKLRQLLVQADGVAVNTVEIRNAATALVANISKDGYITCIGISAGGGISISGSNTVTWPNTYFFGNASLGANPYSFRLFSNSAIFGLNFGGDTVAYPTLKRTGAAFEIKLADDSAFTDLKLRSLIYPIPAVDTEATGPTTSDFNCGYTSSVIGELVYLDAAFTWQKADATTKYDGLLAVALEVKATGQAMKVALPGSIIYCSAKFPALTNAPVYLSETAGELTHTKPVTVNAANRVMGWGVHADKMYFYPSPDYITRK